MIGRNLKYGKDHHQYKHGMCGTKTYSAWHGLKDRCYNEKCEQYPNYGGRGIGVCDRWRNSFENFLSDMGEKPDGYSLERIDVNGDYSPSNCKWASMKEQQRNRRNNKIVTIGGKTTIVIEAAEFFDVSYYALYNYVKRNGDLNINNYLASKCATNFEETLLSWNDLNDQNHEEAHHAG